MVWIQINMYLPMLMSKFLSALIEDESNSSKITQRSSNEIMNRIFNLQRIGSQYHIANNPAISATEHNL